MTIDFEWIGKFLNVFLQSVFIWGKLPRFAIDWVLGAPKAVYFFTTRKVAPHRQHIGILMIGRRLNGAVGPDGPGLNLSSPFPSSRPRLYRSLR